MRENISRDDLVKMILKAKGPVQNLSSGLCPEIKPKGQRPFSRLDESELAFDNHDDAPPWGDWTDLDNY